MIDIRCFRFDVSQILSTCGLRYVIDVNLKSSLDLYMPYTVYHDCSQ